LKRHLRTAYDMSPEQYRARWSLPADYPMVAPSYARPAQTSRGRWAWASSAGSAPPADPRWLHSGPVSLRGNRPTR